MTTITTRRRLLLALGATLLLTPACSSSEGADSGAALLSGCTPDRLATRDAGRLTLSTGVITRPPWVVGGDEKTSGDPREGKGYDAAVGFALAKRLGFSPSEVTWVSTPFLDVIKPGDKAFDINVNQATISAKRRDDVDLSTPYYVMREAVVTLSTRTVTRATSLADLKGVRFAVVDGSPSAGVLTAAVDLATPPTSYPELDKVRGAVSDGTQEALVADFRTALQLDQQELQLVDGVLAGLLPGRAVAAETYGLVLEKDSPLTPCVNAALAAMRADGALDELERRWLIEEPGYRLFE